MTEVPGAYEMPEELPHKPKHVTRAAELPAGAVGRILGRSHAHPDPDLADALRRIIEIQKRQLDFLARSAASQDEMVRLLLVLAGRRLEQEERPVSRDDGGHILHVIYRPSDPSMYSTVQCGDCGWIGPEPGVFLTRRETIPPCPANHAHSGDASP